MSSKYPIRSKVEYVRAYPCAICGETVTMREVINGWIIECGCGEVIKSAFTSAIEHSTTWKVKEGIPK